MMRIRGFKMKANVLLMVVLIVFVIILSFNPILAGTDPMNENYRSVVDLTQQIYSHDQVLQDLKYIINKYPGKVCLEYIGSSVLSRKIPALILGQQPEKAKHKLLIVGNMHAREIHSSQIIIKQIEFYLHNRGRKYQGHMVADIFRDAAIFYIPMSNPDGNEIVFDGIRCLESGTDDWDGGLSIPKNYPQRLELVAKIKAAIIANAAEIEKRSGKRLEGYRFSGKDLTIYKSNANGVDLHYNFYEKGVNEEYIRKYAQGEKRTFRQGPFASEGYIGAYGIDQPETVAVRDFIQKYGLYQASITYHGRMPTVFYDYTGRLRVQIAKEKRDSFKQIAEILAKVSGSPVSYTINGPAGFSGWYQQKYQALSLNIETGYAKFKGKAAYCPLPTEQLPVIWQAQKFVPLQLLVEMKKK